ESFKRPLDVRFPRLRDGLPVLHCGLVFPMRNATSCCLVQILVTARVGDLNIRNTAVGADLEGEHRGALLIQSDRSFGIDGKAGMGSSHRGWRRNGRRW